jgi:hypothetical protein
VYWGLLLDVQLKKTKKYFFMPIVQCPECGKEISTLAKMCPHCGCPQEFILEAQVKSATKETKSYATICNQEVYCPECGESLGTTIKECSNCGCPKDRIDKLLKNEQYISSEDDPEICWFCGKYHATKKYEHRVNDVVINHIPGDDSFKQKVSITAELPCCEQCYEHFEILSKSSSRGVWISILLYLPFLFMLCVLVTEAIIPILLLGLGVGLPLVLAIGHGLGKAMGVLFRNKDLLIYSASLKNSIEDSNFDVKVKNYLKKTKKYLQ